jgi:hypothetical protein
VLAAGRIGLVEIERDLPAPVADHGLVTAGVRAVDEAHADRPRHAEDVELVEGASPRRLKQRHQRVVLVSARVDEDAAPTQRRARTHGGPVAPPRLAPGADQDVLGVGDPEARVDVQRQLRTTAHALQRIEEHLVRTSRAVHPPHPRQSGWSRSGRHGHVSARIGRWQINPFG